MNPEGIVPSVSGTYMEYAWDHEGFPEKVLCGPGVYHRSPMQSVALLLPPSTCSSFGG